MPAAPSSSFRRAGLVLPVLLLLALTGCKGKSTAAAGPTPAHTVAQAPVTTGSTAGTTPGTTGTTSGATKSCPAGDTPGVIGGKSKCLHVGQLCSAKNAPNYPTYGFTCDLTGSRYVLHRKA